MRFQTTRDRDTITLTPIYSFIDIQDTARTSVFVIFSVLLLIPLFDSEIDLFSSFILLTFLSLLILLYYYLHRRERDMFERKYTPIVLDTTNKLLQFQDNIYQLDEKSTIEIKYVLLTPRYGDDIFNKKITYLHLHLGDERIQIYSRHVRKCRWMEEMAEFISETMGLELIRTNW